MKFVLRIIFLKALLLANSAAASSEQILKVAYSDYPPYVYSVPLNPGKPRGVIVEYWEKEVAQNANLKIQWIGPLSYLRAKKMTLSGEADAIYLIPRSVADDEKFLYSKKIKFTTRQGIVVLKSDSVKNLKDLKDIKGKEIGKFAGGHMPLYLKKSGANIVEILADDPIVRGMKMLIDKRLWGFYLVSTEAALFALEGMKSNVEVKILDVPGEDNIVTCTLGFSPKINNDLLKQIYVATEKKDSDAVFKGLLKGAYKKTP